MDKNKRTPLLLSTCRGAWRTASFLIQKGALYTHKDDQDRNLLHYTVLSGGNMDVFCVDLTKVMRIIILF